MIVPLSGRRLRGPERLEDRITPVIGDTALPFVADPYVSLGQDNLAGVVSYDGDCTGALLDRGGVVVGSRHILLAAHCLPSVGDVARFFLPAEPGGVADGTLRQIEILVAAVWVHPGWTGDVTDNLNDIAIVTLENVAPFGASAYEIYTDALAAVTPEVGQGYIMAGYGETGTGAMGQFATIRGELQRLRVNAVGGTYQLGLQGIFTAPLAFNANAAAIELALENALGFDFTVRDVTSGPHLGSVEIWFTDSTTDRPQLDVDTTALTGAAAINTIQNGGARPLRLGQNEYDGLVGTNLQADFDNDGTDTLEGVGDSGGPGFIDLGGGNLAIASIVSWGGFVYGDQEFNTRVSLFTADIQSQINAGPYDLVLDMADQVAGDNGESDEIEVRLVGGNVQIVVDGDLYYQDALANLTSLTIRGSGDDEVIRLQADLAIPITVDAGDGNDTILVETDVTAAVSVVGGLGTDTLRDETGTGHTWEISNISEGTLLLSSNVGFLGVEDLVGGTQDDVFQFGFAGELAGNLDGGGGTDTLDYSSFFQPATVNLQSNTASALLGTFTGIERLLGSGDLDTLIGANDDNLWTLSAANQGDVDGFLFEAVDHLTGGTAGDRFVIAAGASLAGNLEGGTGLDTLDYSLFNSGVLSNLQTSTSTAITGTFAGIEMLVGSAFTDTLVGSDDINTWTLAPANLGVVDGLAFQFYENLRGGAVRDRFFLAPGGSVAGNLDGGAGHDILDYFAFDAAVITNLQSATSTGIGGTFTGIERLIGSSLADTLLGANQPSRWTLLHRNRGHINALFSFLAVERLVGGNSRDIFRFVGSGRVSGRINGGGGGDWLDYRARPAGVFVHLAAGLAPGARAGVVNIEHAWGSRAGGNVLTGNAWGNILIAFGAANSVHGGGGRDLLVGGFGKNTLGGGGGEDIVIAGATLHDRNPVALEALLAEWSRGLPYDVRVTHLQTGGGLAAGNQLVLGATAFVAPTPAGPRIGRGGGFGQSTVFGNAGTDFFVVRFASLVADLDPASERVI